MPRSLKSVCVALFSTFQSNYGDTMRKVFPYIMALLIILLSGCDTEQNYEITTVNPPEETYVYSSLIYLGNGLLYKPDHLTGLYYYDHETGVDIPLCSDVNCSHNYNSSKDCPGIFRTDNIFAYKNKLYYIEEDHFSNNENMLTDFYLSSAELDGTGRKREIYLGQLYSIGSAYLHNDILYLCVNEGYYLEGEDTQISPEHIKGYIAEINMNTLTVENSDILVDGESDSFFINGRLDNKLCLSYNFGKWTEIYYDLSDKLAEYSSYIPEQSSNAYCGEIFITSEKYKPVSIEDVSGRHFELPDDISHIINKFPDGRVFFASLSDASKLYYFNAEEWMLYESKTLPEMSFYEIGSVADIFEDHLIIQKSTNFRKSYGRISISEMGFSEFKDS